MLRPTTYWLVLCLLACTKLYANPPTTTCYNRKLHKPPYVTASCGAAKTYFEPALRACIQQMITSMLASHVPQSTVAALRSLQDFEIAHATELTELWLPPGQGAREIRELITVLAIADLCAQARWFVEHEDAASAWALYNQALHISQLELTHHHALTQWLARHKASCCIPPLLLPHRKKASSVFNNILRRYKLWGNQFRRIGSLTDLKLRHPAKVLQLLARSPAAARDTHRLVTTLIVCDLHVRAWQHYKKEQPRLAKLLYRKALTISYIELGCRDPLTQRLQHHYSLRNCAPKLITKRLAVEEAATYALTFQALVQEVFDYIVTKHQLTDFPFALRSVKEFEHAHPLDLKDLHGLPSPEVEKGIIALIIGRLHAQACAYATSGAVGAAQEVYARAYIISYDELGGQHDLTLWLYHDPLPTLPNPRLNTAADFLNKIYGILRPAPPSAIKIKRE